MEPRWLEPFDIRQTAISLPYFNDVILKDDKTSRIHAVYEGEHKAFFDLWVKICIVEFMYLRTVYMNQSRFVEILEKDKELKTARIKMKDPIPYFQNHKPTEIYYISSSSHPDNHLRGTLSNLRGSENGISEASFHCISDIQNLKGELKIYKEIRLDQLKTQITQLKLFVSPQLDSDKQPKQLRNTLRKVILNGELVSNELDCIDDLEYESISIPSWKNLDEKQKEIAKYSRNHKLTLITGRPGTGKTRLLTAITQCERLFIDVKGSEVQILLTAASNCACDNIVRNLIDNGENSLIRVYSKFVQAENRITEVDADPQLERLLESDDTYQSQMKKLRALEQELLQQRKYDNKAATEKRLLKAAAERTKRRIFNDLLKKYKIIATTIGMACEKSVRGLEYGLVIIDEAFCGNLCAVLDTMMKARKNVILAYDIRQLGASYFSPACELLFKSLQSPLEKIAEIQMSNILTKNYRLPNTTLSLIDKLFYKQNIKVTIHKDKIEMRFVQTQGDESRAIGSIWNPNEIEIVKSILMKMKNEKPSWSIGVIAMYQLACFQLRQQLGNIHDDIFNTVDGFQGKERDCIIIVTSRSNKEQNIGFLADKRRTNVALTRASKLTIIIGDRRTLSGNYEWEQILKMCEETKITTKNEK